MIGGPRLCEPLLATGLGRFTGAPRAGTLTPSDQLSLDPSICPNSVFIMSISLFPTAPSLLPKPPESLTFLQFNAPCSRDRPDRKAFAVSIK
jgi:hypothetical protein